MKIHLQMKNLKKLISMKRNINNVQKVLVMVVAQLKNVVDIVKLNKVVLMVV